MRTSGPEYGQLRKSLHYDKVTGIFTRLETRNGFTKGDEAGTFNNHGHVVIGLDGVTWQASRLAWFYMTQEWPAHRITFRDGNPSNMSFSNLRHGSANLSPSTAARYQRDLRDLNARVDAYIQNDAGLAERFRENFQEARKIRAEVRNYLRGQENRPRIYMPKQGAKHPRPPADPDN